MSGVAQINVSLPDLLSMMPYQGQNYFNPSAMGYGSAPNNGYGSALRGNNPYGGMDPEFLKYISGAQNAYIDLVNNQNNNQTAYNIAQGNANSQNWQTTQNNANRLALGQQNLQGIQNTNLTQKQIADTQSAAQKSVAKTQAGASNYAADQARLAQTLQAQYGYSGVQAQAMAQKYVADQQAAAQLGSSRMSADASRYGSDASRQAAMYAALTGMQGQLGSAQYGMQGQLGAAQAGAQGQIGAAQAAAAPGLLSAQGLNSLRTSLLPSVQGLLAHFTPGAGAIGGTTATAAPISNYQRYVVPAQAAMGGSPFRPAAIVPSAVRR